jgi:hypothetical protein
MEPKKSGKIINIASIAGIGGFSAFHPANCATIGLCGHFLPRKGNRREDHGVALRRLGCGMWLPTAWSRGRYQKAIRRQHDDK